MGLTLIHSANALDVDTCKDSLTEAFWTNVFNFKHLRAYQLKPLKTIY